MLNARLSSGACDTCLILQLNVSSNIRPTSSTGMTASAAPAYSHTNAFPCRAAAAFLSGPSQSHAWKVWDLLSCTALELAHPQHCRMSQPSCCSCSQLAARLMYKALKLNSGDIQRVERGQISDILSSPNFLSLNLSSGSLCLTDSESTSANHSVS